MLKFKKIVTTAMIISLSTIALNASQAENGVQKVKPVSVPGIRLNKGLLKYSLYDTSKDGFKKYVKSQKINGYLLKNLYNRIDNPKSVVLSAYGYDYGYNRPDLAENFYKLFNKNQISFDDKLRYTDFLLRTGRVNEIKDNLSKADCIGNFKYSGKCYYYLGVATYLNTGDHRNIYLNLARHTEPKAKEIYRNKDVK